MKRWHLAITKKGKSGSHKLLNKWGLSFSKIHSIELRIIINAVVYRMGLEINQFTNLHAF